MSLHQIKPPHVHTYVRWKNNKWKRDLCRCLDPYCHQFDERSFLDGKASLCTKCGQEFILTKEALKRVRPMCINCSNTKEAKQIRAARQLLSGVNISRMIDSEINNVEKEKA